MATGRTLQNSVFFFLTICFGFRGSHESRQLKWGDVKLKVDSDGKEFLEFNERLTKTRKGNSEGGSRAFAPKIFAMGGERCPIFFYKIFRSHRPQAMTHDEAPFYLTPKGDSNCPKGVQGIWYAAMAMGVNSITKIAPTMAKNSGITAKITNHSLRKTLCQILYSNRIDPTVIIQLSGHKNVNSVLNYATADIDQQRDMSEILTYTTARKRRPEQPRDVTPPPQKAAQAPPSPPTCHSLDDPGMFEVEPTPPKVAKKSQGPSMVVPRERESEFERVVKSASGLLSNATVHGDVKITINYNVNASSQVSSSLTVSPKLPLPKE